MLKCPNVTKQDCQCQARLFAHYAANCTTTLVLLYSCRLRTLAFYYVLLRRLQVRGELATRGNMQRRVIGVIYNRREYSVCGS
jgi:hypothetical protein